jgi:hypothetical protein
MGNQLRGSSCIVQVCKHEPDGLFRLLFVPVSPSTYQREGRIVEVFLPHAPAVQSAGQQFRIKVEFDGMGGISQAGSRWGRVVARIGGIHTVHSTLIDPLPRANARLQKFHI